MTNRKWLFVGVLLVMPPLSSVAQTGRQEARGSEDVIAFVRGIHADSISYDAAREHTEHSDALLAMLENGDNIQYWSNVTMVLGFTGHGALVDPLIDFLHGGNNQDIPWSTAVYRGRASAITALGYLIHHNTAEDDETVGMAMGYLRASVDPRMWIEREIPWLIAREDSERERLRMRLSTSAVLALALTGRDEALSELHKLAEGGEGVPARLRQVAESALPHWERIKKDGLAEYYRTSDQGVVASRR